jgi:hypothetical protein
MGLENASSYVAYALASVWRSYAMELSLAVSFFSDEQELDAELTIAVLAPRANDLICDLVLAYPSLAIGIVVDAEAVVAE